ncbi:hypothetical protein TYRP_021410 [Tyrophagus putrescentiae]|nr:hypothetical protein TYRP_021410 [Tyrophagus putrescentiae]
MECSLSCCLRWTIYVLGLITLIMSIATIAVDMSDNSNEQSSANEGNGGSYTNKTGANFFLFALMLATGGLAITHYFCSRLYLIAIVVITGTLFTLLRLFMPHKVHFEMIFVVPVLAVVAVVYVWWVGFHQREKDESLWRAMTKPEVHGAGGGDGGGESGAKAGGSSSRLHKKKSSKKKKKGGGSDKEEGA